MCCIGKVRDVAVLAHNVVLTLSSLVTKNDTTLDHAGRDSKTAQLRLDAVLEGNVVLGRNLTGGSVDNTGGDREVAGGHGAGAGKVDGSEVLKVGEDLFGRAVGQDQADGASQVTAEALNSRGDGLLGGLAKSLDHELCLSEEESMRRLTSHVLEMVVAHVVDAENKAVLVLGDGIADVLEELVLVLARLLLDLREVDDL
ncbi:hypothetical protein HG530_003623 [Fusarium avenaceum]|nr:hypothetical protein HG530_003623 [Fusarium avenaceum]